MSDQRGDEQKQDEPVTLEVQDGVHDAASDFKGDDE